MQVYIKSKQKHNKNGGWGGLPPIWEIIKLQKKGVGGHAPDVRIKIIEKWKLRGLPPIWEIKLQKRGPLK